MKDDIDNPEHYKIGGMDVIDYCRMKFTQEEFNGAMKFNVIKYLIRANHKGQKLKDFKKAQHYMDRLVVANVDKDIHRNEKET